MCFSDSKDSQTSSFIIWFPDWRTLFCWINKDMRHERGFSDLRVQNVLLHLYRTLILFCSVSKLPVGWLWAGRCCCCCSSCLLVFPVSNLPELSNKLNKNQSKHDICVWNVSNNIRLFSKTYKWQREANLVWEFCVWEVEERGSATLSELQL